MRNKTAPLYRRVWQNATVRWVLLAAALEFVIYFLVLFWANRYPFGDVPYGVGDAGWQLLSYYGAYWDVLHGRTASSMTFNWELGLGVPAFGDWVNFNASPFLLLLYIFPRTQLELGLVVVTGAILASGAAAMTVFLRTVLPQSRWAWLWGIIWANTGWVWDYALFRTMWLQAVVAMPLLALAAVWCWRGKYFLGAVVIVTFAWTGNYYTAFMASLGAAIFCIAYMIERGKRDGDWRPIGVVRFALAGVVGGLLSTWALLPTLMYAQNAIPFGSGRPWPSLAPLTLARTFFPGASVLYDSPNLFIGVVGLAGLIVFFASRQIAGLTKLVWGVATGVVALTMLVHVIAPLWSLFDAPNGSWFRASFVLVFFLVFLASQAMEVIAAEPVQRLGISLAVMVAFLVFGIFASAHLNQPSTNQVLGAISVVVVAAAIMALHSPRAILIKAAPVVLLIMFVVEAASVSAVTAQFQAKFLAKVPYDGASMQVLRSNTQSSVGTERVAPIHNSALPWNQGPFYGVASGSSSSSLAPPEQGIDLARRYGFRWSAGGRMFAAGDDLISAVMIGSKHQAVIAGKNTQLLPLQSMPFARYQPEAAAPQGANPFQARSAILGADVYAETAALAVKNPESLGEAGEVILPAHTTVAVEARCSSGSIPHLLIPGNGFGVQVDTGQGEKVPAKTIVAGRTHVATFHIVSNKDTVLPAENIRCGNYTLAAQAASQAEAVGAWVDGNTLTLRAAKQAPIVVATAYNPQWQCSNATTSAETAFLTVTPNHTGTITCTYRVPGLTVGILISLLTFVGLVAYYGFVWQRNRKNASKGKRIRGRRAASSPTARRSKATDTYAAKKSADTPPPPEVPHPVAPAASPEGSAGKGGPVPPPESSAGSGRPVPPPESGGPTAL